MSFKLRQLLDLHVTIGLNECSRVYIDCAQKVSNAAQNIYFTAYKRIEQFFEGTTSVNSDVEITECIDMVRHLLELEDILSGHPQLNDRMHQEGEVNGSDMKGMIAALLKRMMKESGDLIADCIAEIQHFDLSNAVQPDSDSLAATQLASHRLDKMRSLVQLSMHGMYSYRLNLTQ